MAKKKVEGIVKKVKIAAGKHTPVPRKPAITVKPSNDRDGQKK